MHSRIPLGFTYQQEIKRNSWPYLTAWHYRDIEKIRQETGPSAFEAAVSIGLV